MLSKNTLTLTQEPPSRGLRSKSQRDLCEMDGSLPLREIHDMDSCPDEYRIEHVGSGQMGTKACRHARELYLANLYRVSHHKTGRRIFQ
jgi:hypothetical protein